MDEDRTTRRARLLAWFDRNAESITWFSLGMWCAGLLVVWAKLIAVWL